MIGLFSLSNAGDPAAVQRGLENFERLTGLSVQRPYTPTPAGPRKFAGDDATRANDFNALLQNPEIDGLLALRGGYGVTRCLDQIDFEALRKKDCLLCGYSDVTALLLAAWKHGCRKLVHGPMLQSSWANDFDVQSLQAETTSFLNVYDFISRSDAILTSPEKMFPSPETICPGYAAGPFLPMNLTLLDTLLGTPFLPDLTGSILALEDIAEPAHDIDRKLNHLRQAGVLKQIRGLVFGQFTNIVDDEYLPEILQEYAGLVKGPVLKNFPFGHSHPAVALPFGYHATLSVFPDQQSKILHTHLKNQFSLVY